MDWRGAGGDGGWGGVLGGGVGVVVNKVHYGPCENSECKERRIGCVDECIFE